MITRIEFADQGQGHGRDLLRFLVASAPALGYANVSLESVTPDGKTFDERFGFRSYWLSNMITSVDDLKPI